MFPYKDITDPPLIYLCLYLYALCILTLFESTVPVTMAAPYRPNIAWAWMPTEERWKQRPIAYQKLVLESFLELELPDFSMLPLARQYGNFPFSKKYTVWEASHRLVFLKLQRNESSCHHKRNLEIFPFRTKSKASLCNFKLSKRDDE